MKTLRKISLKNVSEILSDQQMKLLKGSASGTCAVYVAMNNLTPNGIWHAPEGAGPINQIVDENGQTWLVVTGVSYADAYGTFSNYSGKNWCCDSCAQATWYNF